MPELKNYDEFKFYLEKSDATEATGRVLGIVLEQETKNIAADYPLGMLDVGCSDGEMSFPLIRRLKQKFVNLQCVVIEPEKAAFEKLCERIESQRDYIKSYDLTIEKFLEKSREQQDLFDLILFSQSFYHIPEEKWDEIYKNSIKLLRKDGIIIVTLDSDRGSVYQLKNTITKGNAEVLEFGDTFFAEKMEAFLVHRCYYQLRTFLVRISIPDNEQKFHTLARVLGFLYRLPAEKILAKYKQELENFLQIVKEDNEIEKMWPKKKNQENTLYLYILENMIKVMIIKKELFMI